MAKKNEFRGPLWGLNVVDFGHYYAGPAASMLLADQGANVIRIIKPGKQELEDQQYRVLNRNKKMLSLDIKTEDGKERALSLVEKADVLIENFRPGVMKRLGLDYNSIRDRNPGLIYLSLPGFASTDKERAHIQAWEGVLAAAAMVYTESSTFRQRFNYPPVYTSIPQCSMFGGMHGALAVIAALIARNRYGSGTVIEVPLAEIGLTGHLFMQSAYYHLLEPNRFSNSHPDSSLQNLEFCPADSAERQSEKHVKARDSVTPSPFGSSLYTCADGKKVIINNECFSRAIEESCKILGIWDQLIQEGFVNDGCHDFSNNNLSNGAYLTPARKSRVKQLLTEAFATRPAKEWEDLLSEKSIISMVRTREEWLSLKLMIDSGVSTKMNKGQSQLTMPGRVADVTGPKMSLMDVLQEEPTHIDFEESLQLFSQKQGIVKSRKLAPLKKSDLLKGIKVLDLSNAIAGPNCCYTLAQFGAEVIKVDPPNIDTFHIPVLMELFIEVTQGKRSILTDLKTDSGQKVLNRLVDSANLVVHNSLDNVASRLGIEHSQLKRVNPNIVTCQISGYGGTFRDGWENRNSTDPTAQSTTGMTVQFGSLEEPYLYGGLAPTDMMCGHAAAFASLLGIYQQQHIGGDVETRTSLARGNSYIQLPFIIMEKGSCDWGDKAGQFALGEHWWYRLYQCNDGWVFVGAREDQAQHFAETICADNKANETKMEAAFARQSCEHWLTQLDKAGIACHRVLSKIDYVNRCKRNIGNDAADETADAATGAFCRNDHPCQRPILSTEPSWVRVGENHSYLRLAVGPKPGEHTVEILKELGYESEEIQELINLKVSHEFLPALGSNKPYFFDMKNIFKEKRS